MHFNMIDSVLERAPDRIVTLKQVSSAEEYLQDHFPGFPILPGVMMLESMVQAARSLIGEVRPDCSRHVLGGVRALRYGAMVRPGDAIRVEVTLTGEGDDGEFSFKGVVRHVPAGTAAGVSDENAAQAATGKFTLRPIRPINSAPVANATAAARR